MSAIELSWNHVLDLDLKEYVIQHTQVNGTCSLPVFTDQTSCINNSSTWTSAWETPGAEVNNTEVYRGFSNNFLYSPTSLGIGNHYFLIKALDTTGHYSDMPGYITYNVAAPLTPIGTANLEGENAVITWNNCKSTFNILKYEIFTDDLLTQKLTTKGNIIEEIGTGLSYTFKANWAGLKTFYIVAYDNFNNPSAPGIVSLNIEIPDTTTLIDGEDWPTYINSNSRFDNENYKLIWRTPDIGEFSLPIVHYEIRYGTELQSLSESILIDSIDATEKDILVTWGPTNGTGEASRKYWISPVDSAGNHGTAASVLIEIIAPTNTYINNSFLHFSEKLAGEVLEVDWEVPTEGSLPIKYYETREIDSNWGSEQNFIKHSNTAGFKIKVNWQVDTFPSGKSFYVRAVDTAGNYSLTDTSQFNILKPSSNLNLTNKSNFNGANYLLSWNTPSIAINQLPIKYYEIRYTESYNSTKHFNTATILGSFDTTAKEIKVDWSDSSPRRFWVIPIDSAGNTLDTMSEYNSWYTDAIVTHPLAVNILAPTLIGELVQLDWSAVEGTLPIVQYETRLTDSNWGSEQGLLKLGDTTRYIEKVTWGSTYNNLDILDSSNRSKTYYIKAIDSAGNYGIVETKIVSISAPATVDIEKVTSTVIDNNIIIKWPEVSEYDETETQVSLPIKHYEIYKCPTSNCSFSQVSNNTPMIELGTASAFFETVADNYTYWIKVKDVAGNISAGISISAFINQPPDYELLNSFNIVFNPDNLILAECEGYTTNSEIECEANGGVWKEPSYHDLGDKIALLDDSTVGQALVPTNVDPTYTWDSHFLNNSANNINDLTHLYYLKSEVGTHTFYQKWDIGVQVSAAQLSLKSNTTNKGDIVLETPTLFWSGNAQESLYSSEAISDTSITNWPGQGLIGGDKAAATNMRFVKLKMDYTSNSENDLLIINSQTLTSDLKIINETGNDSVLDAETGKLVTVTKTFIDIKSIIVTANGTDARFAIYDYDGISNSNFTVYLFNSSGTKIIGDFSWSVQGLDGTSGE